MINSFEHAQDVTLEDAGSCEESNSRKVVKNRLEGIYGYGSFVFEDIDPIIVALTLGEIRDSLKEFEKNSSKFMKTDMAKMVMSVKRHLDEGSFEWLIHLDDRVLEIVRYIGRFEGKALKSRLAEFYKFTDEEVDDIHNGFSRSPWYRSITKQLRQNISRTLRKIIDELGAHTEIQQPTKQEEMLKTFMRQDFIATLDDFAPIFHGGADPHRLAQKKLHEIGEKLKLYDLVIERFSVYRIVPLREK